MEGTVFGEGGGGVITDTKKNLTIKKTQKQQTLKQKFEQGEEHFFFSGLNIFAGMGRAHMYPVLQLKTKHIKYLIYSKVGIRGGGGWNYK